MVINLQLSNNIEFIKEYKLIRHGKIVRIAAG